MDVTDVIVYQHHQQRQALAALRGARACGRERLRDSWMQLEGLISMHARAEDLFFYPRLEAARHFLPHRYADFPLDRSTEHDEIRRKIDAVNAAPAGDASWFEALNTLSAVMLEHMEDEEAHELPAFLTVVDPTTRHDAAFDFLAYEAEHLRLPLPEVHVIGRARVESEQERRRRTA